MVMVESKHYKAAMTILTTLAPCDANDGPGMVGRLQEGQDLAQTKIHLRNLGYEVSDSKDEEGGIWVWVALEYWTDELVQIICADDVQDGHSYTIIDTVAKDQPGIVDRPDDFAELCLLQLDDESAPEDRKQELVRGRALWGKRVVKQAALEEIRERCVAAIRASREEMPYLLAVETREVTIPACDQHEGIHKITLTLKWVCPVCGGPRGELCMKKAYDGSRWLTCHSWHNPCGHVDMYEAVRREAKSAGVRGVIGY